MQSIIHFLHEVGMLAHLPRSGFAFLGSGEQSVAEHSHRVAVIAYVLSQLCEEPLDLSKLLLMCLFHDVAEARIGDLNYVNKRYVKADEEKVLDEMKKRLPFGIAVAGYVEEYNAKETLESRLAHDADQLELLLVLKELHDKGNPRAMIWFEGVEKRLYHSSSKKLASTILTTPSDAWWQ